MGELRAAQRFPIAPKKGREGSGRGRGLYETKGSGGCGQRRISSSIRPSRAPVAFALLCFVTLLPWCDCFFGKPPAAAPAFSLPLGTSPSLALGAQQARGGGAGDQARMLSNAGGVLRGGRSNVLGALGAFIQPAFVKWPAKRGGAAAAKKAFRGRSTFTSSRGGGSSTSGRGARIVPRFGYKAGGGAKGLYAAAKKTGAASSKKDSSGTTPTKGYKLVVVESPAKARTIQKFLDMSMYVVDACMGHVRDLPSSAREVGPELKGRFGQVLGVDFTDNFSPLYVVLDGKQGVISRLKAAQKNAGELILATDEDREGEAISWHLLEILKPKIPVKRAVFHEITRDAITKAFESPREIDMALVRAQEARRILDRLAGYTMSPLLWKKIAPKISAGRVQSVGLAMIVRRERQRLNFQSAAYHDLRAILAPEKGGQEFKAVLTEAGGTPVASGKDFGPDGKLLDNRKDKVVILDAGRAEQMAASLSGDQSTWKVMSLETRRQRRRPPIPFITSTLQQEANRKLGMSSKDTMSTAQTLYEGGYITYMRTDNPVLSTSAVSLARVCAAEQYGADTLQAADSARQSKKPKGSQEAHEAIRPALAEDGSQQTFRLPRQTGLSGRQMQLYELIFQRTLASVMVDAELDLTTVLVLGKGGGEEGLFRSSGKVVVNPGWMRAYQDTESSGADGNDDSQRLPQLQKGKDVSCRQVTPEAHATLPPARYTEASFVKELETEGIGRPSTYASILETLKHRQYVSLEGRALMPSLIAFVVTSFLEQHFEDFVDMGFTAEMEKRLDQIARGDGTKENYLAEYYLGEAGLREKVMKGESIEAEQARRALLPILDTEEGKELQILVGPYGPYVQKNGTSLKNSTAVAENGEGGGGGEDGGGGAAGGGGVMSAKIPPDLCSNLEKLTLETLEMCLEVKQGPMGGRHLGDDAETGLPVILKLGPFGLYIQLGGDDASEGAAKPKRVSVPPHAVDEAGSISLEDALAYLSLPRVVCQHPETGDDVKVGIGRYGPFVQYKGGFKSLAARDDVLTIGAARAIEIADTVDKNAKSASEMANLGEHDGSKVRVMDGRFGPYIKWNSVNARMPAEYKEHPTDVPLEIAIDSIREAQAKGGGKKSSAKGGSKAKKATSKKASPAEKGGGKKSGASLKKDEAKPKKALNAYNFYCKVNRVPLVEKGLSFGEITKELSASWKALSSEEMAPYNQMAEEDKVRAAGELEAFTSSAPASPRKRASSSAKSPAKKSAKSPAKKSAAAGPKRPMSSYMHYSKVNRDTVAAGLPFGEATKKVADAWRELGQGEKSRYEDMARDDKERYQREVEEMSNK